MSKPILSELEYNADDVASAILSQADLSVTNQDFGVSDESDNLEIQEGWLNNPGVTAPYLFTFNGFGFFSCSIYHSGGTPSNPECFMKITNSNFHPTDRIHMPTVGYQGDTGQFVYLESNGDISIASPEAEGDATFYIVVNGWYRY